MIVIVPYRPEWPSEFAAIAARIRAAAPEGILALHHIGSTSVPGLAAKDIIDVQITVADMAAADRLPLEAHGFTRSPYMRDHCPPGMTLPPEQLEKRYFKPDGRVAHVHVRPAGRFNQRYPLLCRDYLRTHPGMTLPPEQLEKRYFKPNGRVARVHVRAAGRFNQRYPLLCRDYLRTHPGAAAAYGEIKRQLARLHPDDPEAYYSVKDPVFDLIMAGAEDWAAQTNWSAPPSD